jgi:hypothetical protein
MCFTASPVGADDDREIPLRDIQVALCVQPRARAPPPPRDRLRRRGGGSPPWPRSSSHNSPVAWPRLPQQAAIDAAVPSVARRRPPEQWKSSRSRPRQRHASKHDT